MALNIIREINVDFHDSRYIQVNAKQYDMASRFILVSCYNQGEFFPINYVNHYAYIRYKKSDGKDILNTCQINYEGKVLIELTKQMLASPGSNLAELVLVNNNPVETINNPVVENTGELIDSDDSILTTMNFCINVIENTVDHEDIESTDEYNALNELLIKATEDYTYVLSACKVSEDNAKSSENAALASQNAARTSELKAKESETNTKNSETNARTSEINTSLSESKALKSEQNAKESEQNALLSEQNSKNSELMAKSYAIGETGMRTNENEDNAKYYYEHTKLACDSLSGAFTPMGTISFAELASVSKDTGYMYYINESFVTDSTFKRGPGETYMAGTMVYWTADGYWDCMLTRVLIVEDDGEGNVILDWA